MARAQGVREPVGRCHDDGLEAQICQPRVRARLLLVGGDARTRRLATGAAERLRVKLSAHDDVVAAAADLAGERVSCVLLDAAAPEPLALMARLRDARQDAPIVVLGDDDESPLAVAAVQAGAQDYVVRDDADGRSLERVIRYAIDRKRTEVELARLALHDGLTGLPNRTLFDDRLNDALRRRRAGRGVAVLFIDIDGFKRINDSLGHSAGDTVLREAAARLRAAVRPGDTVARLGGDEFTVLCEDVGDEADALGIGERIAAELGHPLDLDGEEIVLRASIGVAVARSAAVPAGELLRLSDEAMYAAKACGNGQPRLHAAGIGREQPGRELQLEAALRRAIPEELVAWYQPIVSLDDARVVAVEALVRWQHPTRGLVTPGEFIPVAEDTGLVVPVGAWMLEEACRTATRWGDVRVSVNVSGRQVAAGSLVEAVRSALRVSGLSPERLQLGLTETVLMDDVDRHAAVVNELKALGVSLALDDFGKGYSSLSYLRRFPFDRIKIDRSFVAGLPDSRPDTAIVSAVTSFARALDLEVVAEGVETEAQLAALRELGCEYAQGYLFHRPMPAAGVDELLR
jgi:diguanylate cyclase (GGDEF)-like protein